MPVSPPSLCGELAWLLLSYLAVCALAFISGWVRSWLFSGSVVESLLILFGPLLQSVVPPWVLVLCLNAIYAVASTSWLLRVIFAVLCWPLVVATSIAQYVLISSFTRAKLRWLLRQVHFYRDKMAFFAFPVLIIDADISGFVAVEGVTASLLSLSIEFHSIDIGLNIGQGHEIHAHTDSLEITLFRRIAISEIFAAHKCPEDEKQPACEVDGDQPHMSNENRIVKDNIRHEASIKHQYAAPTNIKISVPNSTKDWTQSTALDDEDAELRYADILKDIRTGGGLYKMRERLRNVDREAEYTDIELRAMLCTELRRTGLSTPQHSRRITTSKLATLFPEPNIFEYVPSAMRALLWLASHTHPIDCPSISIAGSGHWLNSMLSHFIFRRHLTDDQRIRELEREVSEWLSVGEYCVDLADITALGQVPLRSVYNIKAEIRSTNIAVSRIDVEDNSSAQMASLAGVDGTFVIPTCLLPNHSHLVPPKPSALEIFEAAEKKKQKEIEKRDQVQPKTASEATSTDVESAKQASSEDESATEAETVDIDALGILMSIRATLPAHFDESCLSFAATLSKAAQMMDIEESIVDPPTPMYEEDFDPTENFRDKFSRRSKRFGSAIKHPLQTAHGAFHREMRKATVMTVNGAWFAKWTNKVLEQLAWLNGDVGYTFEIPVSLKPYR
ncbi:hypothetical protein MBLNU13_g10170t1 [Cladosporium sp. NU13]